MHGSPSQPSPERHLRPIPRPNLFQVALSAIEQYVDELPAGARLQSERELALHLDVSRPLVRQALKVLEGLGKVESRPGSGTFIREDRDEAARSFLLEGLRRNDDLLRHVVAARSAIEVAIIDALSDVWDPVMTAQLEECIRRSDASTDGYEDVRVNLEFEAGLGELSGNIVLQRLQSLLHSAWLEAHRGRLGEPTANAMAAREHRLILDALRTRDLSAAHRLMEEHIHGVGNEAARPAFGEHELSGSERNHGDAR